LSPRHLFKSLKTKLYKTVTLPVVLYGCETSSLTLREENSSKVYENSGLRKIFGLTREVGAWTRLHNEELHNLYAPPTIIRVMKLRRMRRAGNVARIGEEKCIQYFGWEN
jgi:hypothetical protein